MFIWNRIHESNEEVLDKKTKKHSANNNLEEYFWKKSKGK